MYITANVATWAKRRSDQASQLSEEEKFFFDAGAELDINWAKSAGSDHWICEVAKPRLGFLATNVRRNKMDC